MHERKSRLCCRFQKCGASQSHICTVFQSIAVSIAKHEWKILIHCHWFYEIWNWNSGNRAKNNFRIVIIQGEISFICGKGFVVSVYGTRNQQPYFWFRKYGGIQNCICAVFLSICCEARAENLDNRTVRLDWYDSITKWWPSRNFENCLSIAQMVARASFSGVE